jgi:AraC-like DNA-binding protein
MHTLWSVTLLSVLRAWERLGLDTEKIRRDIGITDAFLEQHDSRFNVDPTGVTGWDLAERQWKQSGIGLATGRQMRFGELSSLDYVLSTSATLHAGLEAVARFSRLLQGESNMALVSEPPELWLTFVPHTSPKHVRDAALAAMAVRMRTVGGQLVRVQFEGPPYAPHADYTDAFDCPVTFEAPESRIYIDPEAAGRPLQTADPHLRAIITRDLERLQDSLGDDEFAGGVRRAIAAARPGNGASLEYVSKQMAMSGRTLQRHLADSGTSFRQEVETVRKSLAVTLLRDKRMGAAEVGYLVGYAEPSAFSKAFKRWTGTSPSEYG